MISMMDAIYMEHDRVHRTYSQKPKRTKSGLPKRLWSLQSIASVQQWRKIGPHPLDIEERQQKHQNKKATSKTELGDDIMTPSNNDIHGIVDHGSIHSMNEEEENDQDHKRRLRRKAANGLKRIITHFSLSDANSFSATPELTSTALHPHTPFNTNYDVNHQQPTLLLSEETSLNTLSTVPDIMQEIQAEFEMDHYAEEGKGNTMRHHYRSQSYPNVTMSTAIPDVTVLADRLLPPLPTDEIQPSSSSKKAIHHHHQHQVQVEQKFRQAVHWLGKPFHRFLSSSMITTMANNSPHTSIISPLKIHAMSSPSLMADARTAAMLLSNHDSNEIHQQGHCFGSTLAIQEEQEDLPWVQDSSRANGKMLDLQLRFNRKKVLRCRVVQITNIASSKECQYELFIQMNDVTQASQMGTMKKIAKGISAASPKESFSFEVDSPFTLAFVLCAKSVHGGLSKMKTLISKMDLAASAHNQESAISANEEDGTLSPSNSNLPMVGSTQLLSGNRFEAFSGKGLSRYTLTKPLSSGKNQKELQEMDIELMVAFQLEDAVSPTHTYMSGLWTGELDFDAALASCHQGDYLTFYVRSKQFPTWTRYWITLEHGQIYFRHLSYEHKEAIDCIPLSELESVCKPWEDILEQVYFGRKHGIVLKFKKEHIRMDQINLDEGECLNGYMYLFADSPKKAALWRTVLSAYATADYVTPNASINARYLW